FIIENKYTSTEKLKVIGNGSSNGINTDYFSPDQIPEEQKEILKSQLHIKADDFVFVFVGRVVGDKRINELVKAFQNFAAQESSSKLVLVGSLESELDPLKTNTLKEIETNPNIIAV